ncbi:ATP-binding cassette domain-containing protein [Candidatus Uabimicrobium sp. HlEnr_7]|uniref:ATP-binding cassette domain-containing protein n=1 Tax=Candidatus Uabimicrobium helgolandensis TaxID=3095367 RepID=UPI0035589DCF
MSEALITVKNLSIRTETRSILSQANFQINKGKITLLIGGSGGGKTVLLKILSGLLRKNHPSFYIEGEVLLNNKNILQWKNYSQTDDVGIVFQDYGLLDDYSISQNIDFAFCHSRSKVPVKQRKAMFQHLTEKLSVNPKLPIQHASGGQKRRIAIARTLAYNPDVIIYDEPTAGLDPKMAQNVAQLIQKTHCDFNKQSSIIVTHDYQEFLPIADHVLFLDPSKKRVYEVSKEQLQELINAGYLQVPIEAPSQKNKLTQKLEHLFISTCNWSIQTPLRLAQSVMRTLPLWRSYKWGTRFFLHYCKMLAFLSSIFYLAMAGAIIGSVSAYFSFKFLPYRHITRQLITEDVLTALGFGLYRVIIPIFASILIAARSGAAVASDIGNRVYLQETDSMRSMSCAPSSYLQTGSTLAFLVSVPILTLMTFAVARFFCLVVFSIMHPEYHPVLGDAIFHKLLRDGNGFFYLGTSWLIAKSLVCGWGLANICYYIGMRAKSSAKDISRDITFTVIWGTLFVMVTHAAFAFIEFSKKVY